MHVPHHLASGLFFSNFIFLCSSHTKPLKFLEHPACSLFPCLQMGLQACRIFASNVFPLRVFAQLLGSGVTSPRLGSCHLPPFCGAPKLCWVLLLVLLYRPVLMSVIALILCSFDLYTFHLTRWAIWGRCLCCIYWIPQCLEQGLRIKGRKQSSLGRLLKVNECSSVHMK